MYHPTTTYNPYAISHLTLDDNAPLPPEQEVSYTVFDKVARISNGHGEARIVYGLDHQRAVLKEEVRDKERIKLYFMEGSYTKTEKPQGYRELCYIPTPAGQVLLHEKQGDSSQWLFLTTDHLGSPQHIINEQGELLQTLSFAPYGKRRNPTNWLPYTASTIQPNYIIDRGFTGHEHFDALGFINMTGRIYDPELGRFLSPDPYVQMPDYSQNFNRYSYCLNNPLKYTDPSGELFIVDDLIVAGVGFTIGYVSYGTTHGDWGGNAFAAGGIGAGTALLSYYTAGGFGLAAGGTLSGGSTFAGNYAISSIINSLMPNASVPITDNFSISMSVGLGVSAKGLGAGFNISGNFSRGDFSASLSYGAGEGGSGSYSGYGGGIKIGNYGAGYYRTSYSGANSQVVGGVSLSYKDVSFRLENDFFGDGHDRWRSNAFELSIGDFVLGSNLYNNDVYEGVPAGQEPPVDDTGMLLNNSCNRPCKGKQLGAWANGQTYSSPLWVGFKANGQVYRFGYSHPLVQDRTQNVVHKWFGPGRTNFFNKYDYFQYGTYNYYGYSNPYSLW